MQHPSGRTWQGMTTAALLLAMPMSTAFGQVQIDEAPRLPDAVVLPEPPSLRPAPVGAQPGQPAAEQLADPLDVDDHLTREQKREQAEALIAGLADADDQEVGQIELQLAALGEVSLVPLKLAALGDNFELRSRAGAMARRLRWRLVCSESLLAQAPAIPRVMAGDEQPARRAQVDRVIELVAASEDDAAGFFNECLADRDTYIRERGVDGLVAVGRIGDEDAAVAALERAALSHNDDSVVLLAVAGLGELGRVDIDVLAELFERTDSAEVQRTVLLTAGYSRQASAISLIERALKDPRWRIRAAGLEALEDIKSNADKNKVAELVMPLLADPEPFIAATALRLVTELELPGAAQIVFDQIESGQIEEAAGLEILAEIKDPRAKRRILVLYATANGLADHDAASRWLSLLRSYGEDVEIGRLLIEVLADEARRAQWPTALLLTNRFSDNDRLMALVTAILVDSDPDLRQAGWGAISGGGLFRNRPITPAIDRQLADGDTLQRLWRLDAHFMHYNRQPTDVLIAALADPEPQIISRALAMLGSLELGYDLGITDLPYRPDRGEYVDEFDPLAEAPGDNERVWGIRATGASNPLLALLDHNDIPLRTRAATLLYLGGADRGERVTAVLRSALQSDLPLLQAMALRAATAEPGELVAGVDVAALMNSGTLPPDAVNAAAVVVLLTDGDVEAVAGVVADIDFRTGSDFFLLLAGTGNKEALDLLEQRLRTDTDYYVRRFMEQLVSENIAAAATLMPAYAENPGTDDWDLESVFRTVLQSNDPAAVPLLEAELERRLQSNEPRYRRDYLTQQIEQRLIALDPERATKMIGAKLVGDPLDQQEAIARLVQMNPSDAMVELVLNAATSLDGPASPAWRQVGEWVIYREDDQPDYLPRFIESINKLPGPMQAELLSVVHVGDELSFDQLLAFTPRSERARARAEMLVAEHATRHPAARPADAKAMNALPDLAKGYLLSAAGQWDGGDTLIRPYLDHDNADLSAAALRGLAIHTLLIERPELTEAEVERFAAGVLHEHEFTAYLCAEVLYQFAPQRLLAVDAEKATSVPALLRYAAASNQRLPGRPDQVLIGAIRSNQAYDNTLLRLALVAAVNQGQPRIFRIVPNRVLHGHPGLVQRLALEQRQFQEFILAAQLGQARPGDEGVDELVELTTRRLVGRGDARLGTLVEMGFIDQVAAEDLAGYLDAMARHWSQRYAGWTPEHLLPLIDTAGPAAAEVRERLKQSLADTRDGRLVAALLLWHLDRDEAALEALLDRALTLAEDGNWTSFATNRSLIHQLKHTPHPAIAPRLLAALGSLHDEDWGSRNQRKYLIEAITSLDADAARGFFKSLSPEQWALVADEQYSDSWGAAYDQLNLMVIDQSDYAARRVTPDGPSVWYFTEDFETLMKPEPADIQWFLKPPPWGYTPPLRPARPADERRQRTLERLTAEISTDPELIMDPLTYRFTLPDIPTARPLWFVPFQPSATRTRDVNGGQISAWRNNQFYRDPAAPSQHYLYPAVRTGHHQGLAGTDGLVETLRPLLESEDDHTRIRAMRAVVDLQLQELAPAVMEKVGRDGPVGIEAAWASAVLRGTQARGPIAAWLAREDDFETRVELACLLVLLGDDPADHADLRTFGRLLTAQRLRGRAVTMGPAHMGFDLDQALRGTNRGADHEQTQYEVIGDGDVEALSSDLAALYAAAVALPEELPIMARLDFKPLLMSRGERPAVAAMIERRAQPTLQASFDGRLALHGLPIHGLPISDLVGASAPMFADLPRSEQWLFAQTFNQLSAGSDDAEALQAAWRAWLDEHGGKGPDAMWRLGVESAVSDLTDKKWWQRMLAQARLERLSGRAIDPPGLFEAEQWLALQQHWQAWLESEASASPRAALIASARKTDRIDAEQATIVLGEGHASDKAYLELLVTLAGRGDLAQSRAALHQLDHWPDGDALLRAVARWQTSPRAELRAWYLDHAATGPRIYVHADELGE